MGQLGGTVASQQEGSDDLTKVFLSRSEDNKLRLAVNWAP